METINIINFISFPLLFYKLQIFLYKCHLYITNLKKTSCVFITNYLIVHHTLISQVSFISCQGYYYIRAGLSLQFLDPCLCSPKCVLKSTIFYKQLYLNNNILYILHYILYIILTLIKTESKFTNFDLKDLLKFN